MAVDNFIAFKKLMIKRNTELNEEALKMMLQKEKQQIIQAVVQKPHPAPVAKKEEVTTQKPSDIDPEFLKFEQDEFEAALKASMAQEESRKQEQIEEEEMIKTVIEASAKEEEARLIKAKEIEKKEAEIIQLVSQKSIKEAAPVLTQQLIQPEPMEE